MGIILNDKQKNVISEAKKFYKSSSQQVFEFAGYAGTGKSVVLNAIKDELDLKYDEIAPMSYIGQAAINMRFKGFPNAKTCHSWLYQPKVSVKKDKNGKIIYNEYFDRPVTNIDFEYKPLYGIKAIFLDEAGAVPYELAQEIESRGIKIFATGDLGQLPPVMSRPKYLYGKNIMILDEIMRQREGSGILYLAEMARKGTKINIGTYGNDAIVIPFEDFNLETLADANIVVCGKNKTKDIINTIYRKHILRVESPIPIYGEKLICRKNNWNIESNGINLANGLIGHITNEPDISSFDGDSFNIDFIPDMCEESPFYKIPVDFKYFVAPAENKKDCISEKWYTGEKFEFAYAITCHCAQGAQYYQGIYLEDFMPRDIQPNINYTGITRFSNKLVYIKPKMKKYY